MSFTESFLNTLQEVNERHGRLAESHRIIGFMDKMKEEKVCVPIIGKFSSGKSRAINTIFGRTMLKESVNPTTAFPTEIQYTLKSTSAGQVQVFYHSNDDYGEKKNIIYTLDQYMKSEHDKLDPKDVDFVRLYTGHEFFKSVKDIRLVDMPGFDSGNDIHDRAINDYVAKSMSYIIAFSAESSGMVISESLIGILKELITLHMPICVMITKLDQAPPEEEYRQMFEQLRTNLEKHTGVKDFELIETSSGDNDVDELKEYLTKLQNDSITLLLKQKILPFYLQEANNTLLYLKAFVSKSNLSESKLKEDEALLRDKIEQLEFKAAEYKQKFLNETAQCAQEILGDAQNALNSELNSYISMAMNGDEQMLAEKINSTIRVTVQGSFQNRFVPKAKKYAEKVTAEIAATDAVIMGVTGANDNLSDSGINLGAAGFAGIAAVGGATALLAGGMAPIMIGTLAIPVIGIVATVIAALGFFVGCLTGSGERERAETRNKLRQQFLASVFPNALAQLRPNVESAIKNSTDEICADIEKSVRERKDTFKKALADSQKLLAEEAEQKDKKLQEITKDIQTIERDVANVGK